jgi:hypothetical protein
MTIHSPGTVLVTALRDGTHAGIRYVRGECVALPAIDAAILARRREVSLTKPVGRPAVTPTRRQKRAGR